MHTNTTTLPARTAFLRQAERHDLAAGLGLAQLAMWYASEGIPFEDSVAALADRAGDEATVIRVAYECLAFGQLSHSTHSQVIALFTVDELRRRREMACDRKRRLAQRLVAAIRRRGHDPGAFPT